MLTLNTTLSIPAHVSFSVVGDDAFLLNTQTNKYFGLEKVGARLWELLNDGRSLKDAHQTIINEYDVDPVLLEKEILELINHLLENSLVETAHG